MATQAPKGIEFLYLDQITLQDATDLRYELKLFVGEEKKKLEKVNRTWKPVQLLFFPDIRNIQNIQNAREPRNPSLGQEKEPTEGRVDRPTNAFQQLLEFQRERVADVVIGEITVTLQLHFSASPPGGLLRESLQKLEELMEVYSPVMSKSTERAVDKAIQLATATAFDPIAKAVLNVVKYTFELMKEQRTYDQMPSSLFDSLRRVLPVADKVNEEIVSEETDILNTTMPRMFDEMQKTVNVLCDYVKRGRFKRAGDALTDSENKEVLEKMDRELSNVIVEFERAINVETLREVRKAQQTHLLERLKPSETNYDLNRCCMKDTRNSCLEAIKKWVAEESEGKVRSDIYWISGSPGIGKTALAHSICESLDHQGESAGTFQGRLAGAFFCQKVDQKPIEPRSIRSTLIYRLALVFPLFRQRVAGFISGSPTLTPETMKDVVFLQCFDKYPRSPDHFLVFVIDALDECGDDRSRPVLLELLAKAVARASWLKIIITSRPEADIEGFFDKPPYLKYDLGKDPEASEDLLKFTQQEFREVAKKWRLPETWPEQSLLDEVISRASGLFIFIRTLALALLPCADPTKLLKETSKLAGAGLERLYGLYSRILTSLNVPDKAEFQRVIGVLLTVAPYRALCDETIAELAGVYPNLVKKWVDELSSLLERGTNGEIRVRHLSISEFFHSKGCSSEYRIDRSNANIHLGIACLKTMVSKLRFNICGLEDSLVANADAKDLHSRITEKISGCLQYSSLYWSDHVCFTPNKNKNGDQREKILQEFFEGLRPIYWIEVLSLLTMVPIGAPSIRKVKSWAKDCDSTLIEKIEDVRCFITVFRTPIIVSAPHTYLSTMPYLPKGSTLSKTFSESFHKGIQMLKGKLNSWPELPLEWIGHTGTINCASYSPDGRQIVSGSSDGTIRIWEVDTGFVIGEPINGHTNMSVTSVAYSPDGRRIISGSMDKQIRIWNVETGTAVGSAPMEHTRGVRSVAYSPDGRHIISGSNDKTIRIWDAETGHPVGNPLNEHTAIVRCVTYSPDGHHFISGSYDQTIRIWDAKTYEAVGEPLDGHGGWVQSVAYSPDGLRIVSGYQDGTIRIWDAEARHEVRKLPMGGFAKMSNNGVRSVAYSPDGLRIISGYDDNTIRIWNPNADPNADPNANPKVDPEEIKKLEGHSKRVESVAYSPDGLRIISASADKTIRIWDASKHTAVGKPIERHSEGVWSVAYSPDGHHIISGSEDETIRIWDAETGAAVGEPLKGHTRGATSVTYSPDGLRIVSGCYDGTIRIWNAETSKAIGDPLKDRPWWVRFVAYSPDGNHFISGGEGGQIRIWNANTLQQVDNPIQRHSWCEQPVAYSHDGRHIISGSTGISLRIWDAETGAAVGEPLRGHCRNVRTIACSPDGCHIISGSGDKTIRIWDGNTGHSIGEPLVGHSGDVRSVAYFPIDRDHSRRRHIISGSDDKTIRIWDLKTFKEIRTLEGHTGSVQSVAYSPDGRHFISGSLDGTIRIWDVDTGDTGSRTLEGKNASDGSAADSPNGQPSDSHNNTRVAESSPPEPSSSDNTIGVNYFSKPDSQGWIKDSAGGLLYWVPLDCRRRLHSPDPTTIPIRFDDRPVSLDFENFVFGTAWREIEKSAKV